MAEEKSDQEYEDEWIQIHLAVAKYKEAVALLEEVQKMKQADGRFTIRLRSLRDQLPLMQTQVRLLDDPDYMRCFECGFFSMHTVYRIKGSRSHCCNA